LKLINKIRSVLKLKAAIAVFFVSKGIKLKLNYISKFIIEIKALRLPKSYGHFYKNCSTFA